LWIHVDNEGAKPLRECGRRKPECHGGLPDATLEGTYAHDLHKINLSRQVVCRVFVGCFFFRSGQKGITTLGRRACRLD
jgi:hypothetical protein